MTDTPYIRPDMKAFIDMMAQVNGPKLTDMTLEDARASYVALHNLADRPARTLPPSVTGARSRIESGRFIEPPRYAR